MSERTHCKNGHELTPENDGRRGDGAFYCKECNRIRHDRWYHAKRAREGFTVMRTKPKYISFEDWFWLFVDRRGENECWPWIRNFDKDGYGKAQNPAGEGDKAHRVVWMLTRGEIPEGIQVRHIVCDNPPCCNPAHLALGTNADNMRDKVAHGRAAKGEAHGRAKLTETDVLLIRKLRSEGLTYTTIAEIVGSNKDTVRCAGNGQTWKHLPMKPPD
jgi:hypothetical protein